MDAIIDGKNNSMIVASSLHEKSWHMNVILFLGFLCIRFDYPLRPSSSTGRSITILGELRHGQSFYSVVLRDMRLKGACPIRFMSAGFDPASRKQLPEQLQKQLPQPSRSSMRVFFSKSPWRHWKPLIGISLQSTYFCPMKVLHVYTLCQFLYFTIERHRRAPTMSSEIEKWEGKSSMLLGR